MHLPFSLPKRVSRLYPLFSIILLFNSTILLYAWQLDQIKLESYTTFDEREKALKSQVQNLLDNQKQDKAKLDLQIQKVNEASNQLTDLQKQLAAKSTELTSKEDALSKAQEQLKNQQGQLSQNAADLEKLRTRPPLFSFQNESSIANIASKEADVKLVVSQAYDYIQQLYGDPYLLNSITITFVDSFSIKGSSGEIVIENSNNGININIHLKDFDKNNFQDLNTIIHEVIHGFHGVAVLDSSALEEGMTVAATDAVMAAMIKDGKLPSFDHLYLTINDDQYTNWNTSLKVPADNQALYSGPSVAKLYQLMGTAWYRLYQADPNVFKKINADYYPKVQKGLTPDAPMVLSAIRNSISSVNGQPINSYLSTNQAFNPS